MGISRIVKGSARGARVAGSIWAIFVTGAGLFMAYAFNWWEVFILSIAAASFLAIRPWFMGVFLIPGAIEVKGWYGLYRIPQAEVLEIDLRECISALVGFGTGFIPFVGKVRMITIETQQSGRWRKKYLPGTLGRYNTVLKVVREMRVHVGFPK